MNKGKLVALLRDIENHLNEADSTLAIFELIQGDEAIPKLATDIRRKMGGVLDIELADLKECVNKLR